MNVEEGKNALRHKTDKWQKSKSCRMEKTDLENAKNKKTSFVCICSLRGEVCERVHFINDVLYVVQCTSSLIWELMT